MKITILGGAGFLGRKIAAHLTQTGTLGGRAISELTLFDLAAPLPPAGAPFPVHSVAGDLVELPAEAIPPGTAVVFHLAAVVSAAAEADYELGRRVNLRGTDAVVDACRRLSLVPGARPPRVVFTSSVASFSGGQGAVLADDARQVPANSYGAQKAAAELVLADASRRGFLDAVSIRLPTITVRPGRPNKAASSFLSSILREPLLGMSAELPVGEDFAAWIASPRRAVDWLLHAAALDTAELGLDRGINPPGISATVAQMLAALEAVKPGASALVRPVADADIAAIVGTWPAAFAPVRAGRLGFAPHEPLEDLVRAFVADDLEATRHERGLPD
jgi:nucleoside-diphosphate-sugar epimerase